MTRIKYLLLFLLLLQFNSKLLSQDVDDLNEDFSSNIDGFAFNPKIGPAFAEYDLNSMPSIGIEFNIRKNNFIYSIDYIGHNLIALIFNEPCQNQLGIMMGKYLGERYFRIQYQAGINMFWGEYASPVESSAPFLTFGGGPRTSFSTVGAASKVGLKFVPSRKVSIGIDLLLNLNFENSMFMPMLSIEFGELRNAIESPRNR